VDRTESNTATQTEPFLLHESSRAYLDGDPDGIRRRFAFRRDALDYLAMAGVVAGALLVLANLMQMARGAGRGDELNATVSALGLGVLLILAGGYYVSSRQGAAAARSRLVREGQVLPGVLASCTARDETTTEGALGEVTRSYLVAVEYRFTTPAGDERDDHDEHNRPDLRRAELPEPGAAVRVLYLDERTYALL
jgi:hypothetical protein